MSENQKQETTYLFATRGSITARGGRVSRVTTKVDAEGHMLARVGDIVTYEDGTEANIIDGAGAAATWCDTPFALVGSHLSNGDRIVESLQSGMGIDVHPDRLIPGQFDRSYVYQASGQGGGGRANA
jgi:uncharacterized Zn-binding protein involved in type VI secretion